MPMPPATWWVAGSSDRCGDELDAPEKDLDEGRQPRRCRTLAEAWIASPRPSPEIKNHSAQRDHDGRGERDEGSSITLDLRIETKLTRTVPTLGAAERGKVCFKKPGCVTQLGRLA